MTNRRRPIRWTRRARLLGRTLLWLCGIGVTIAFVLLLALVMAAYYEAGVLQSR